MVHHFGQVEYWGGVRGTSSPSPTYSCKDLRVKYIIIGPPYSVGGKALVLFSRTIISRNLGRYLVGHCTSLLINIYSCTKIMTKWII